MASGLGNDNRLPQGRLAVVSYVIVGLTLLLLAGFWKLQVLDSGHYSELAEKNRVRTIPLIAPRGRMLDRDGRVLVDNYPSFSVLLLRDDMSQVNKALPQIAEGLGISPEDIHQQTRCSEVSREVRTHRHQAGSEPGGYRLHRIASRGFAHAGNDSDEPAALSLEMDFWRARSATSEKSAKMKLTRATGNCGRAICPAKRDWKNNITTC